FLNQHKIRVLSGPRIRGDRQSKDGEVVYPVGFSDKPVPDPSVQEADRDLLEKRCWDVALGPLKQIPMNLFIMYMSLTHSLTLTHTHTHTHSVFNMKPLTPSC
uniref:ER membrane protein complex subunit 4 n=1 Tax=Sinocyclocheilus rhinocerous TaxID=307959 RepID=A0A673I2H1_9TELE